MLNQLGWLALVGGLVPSTILTVSGLSTGTIYYCRNAMYPKNEFSVTSQQVQAALQAAGGPSKGLSQYPHVFVNADGPKPKPKKQPGEPYITADLGSVAIKWPNQRCNKGYNGNPNHETWEYPVLLDGKVWPKNELKKGADPGPARVIFMSAKAHGTTWQDLELCGVVAHTKGNEKELKLCTT